MEDRIESLTQKKSHGSSDKEHPVLFRPLFPHIWGCHDSVLIREFVSGAMGCIQIGVSSTKLLHRIHIRWGACSRKHNDSSPFALTSVHTATREKLSAGL